MKHLLMTNVRALADRKHELKLLGDMQKHVKGITMFYQIALSILRKATIADYIFLQGAPELKNAFLLAEAFLI